MDKQKKALQTYSYNDSNGKPSYKALQQWFSQKYNHTPALSTILKILTSKAYERLNEDSKQPGVKQNRSSQWPELEVVLFEWQQRMQMKRATITRELIWTAAQDLWIQLPQFNNDKMSGFSNGWLTAFKQRHNLRQWMRHDKAGVVDCKQLELDLATIREELQAYNNDSIYNMDKTALYWKTSSDCTIATKQMAGRKAVKARFTTNLCCNAFGSDKVWCRHHRKA